MNYLCPKCKNIMTCVSTASLPAIHYYWCYSCGYKSKTEKDNPDIVVLPRRLWTDDEGRGEQE